MSPMMLVGVALIAMIVGAFVAFLLVKQQQTGIQSRIAKLEADLDAASKELTSSREAYAGAQARLEELDRQRQLLAEREVQLEAARTEAAEAKAMIARLESEVEARREALETAANELNAKFTETATKVLHGQRESFFDLAKEKLEGIAKLSQQELESRKKEIDHLLKPVDEKLKNLNDQLGQLEKQRHGAYESLMKQVETLTQSQKALSDSTSTLTQALRGSSQRGRWGEIQLRRLVELSEMSPYCDFEEQASTESDEGRQRPDLFIKLPNSNRIVVDSKVPFNIWVEAEETADATAREAKLKEFAKQVRTAVNGLGQRNYKAQFDSVEFVVMFLPGEHYLADALRADPELLEYGFSKRVVLATPTTLLALLRTVHLGWQNAKLADAARDVAEEGKKLHKHIGVFLTHFESVKKHFRNAADALDRTESTANRGIASTARRLEKLGAKSEKALPPSAIVELDDLEEAVLALPESSVVDDGEAGSGEAAEAGGLFDDESVS